MKAVNIKDKRDEVHCVIWDRCPENMTCAECKAKASQHDDDDDFEEFLVTGFNN